MVMRSVPPSASASFPEMRIAIEKIIAGFRFGVHRSALRGKGFEFKGLRPYDPADSPSQVDWAASARLSDDDAELVSRDYEPERALSVFCLIDSAPGMEHPPKKMQAVMFLLWLFAISAFKYRDSFSCVFFSRDELYASGLATREEVLREFLHNFANPDRKKKYSIPGALLPRYLSSIRLHDTLVVVVSDFFGNEWREDAYQFRNLSVTGKNTRVIYFALDEWSGFVPVPFDAALRDAASGVSRMFSLRDESEAVAQKKAQEERFTATKKALHVGAAPFISVPIFEDFPRIVYRKLLTAGFE